VARWPLTSSEQRSLTRCQCSAYRAGPLFNVTRVVAPVGGRLILAGAGMLQTTLNLTTHGNDVIHGSTNTVRFTVRDLTFARPALTTTQGQLVRVDSQSLTFKVAPGFPQVDALLLDRIPRLEAEQGLFVKRYRTGFADGPHVVINSSCAHPNSSCPWPMAVNEQVHFSCGGDGEHCPNMKEVSPGVWNLQVTMWPPGELDRYAADIGRQDAIVAIKIKHGGQAFNIRNGEDLSFEDVRWLGHCRGVMYNCSDVLLRNTRIDRDPSVPATQAMATPGGGPQIYLCNNATVVNHTATGTGDDSLALFHVAAGSVTGSHIRDSFARGILLCNVSDAVAANVRGNEVLRCPIWRPPNSAHVDTC
jgi:hypothetical protein